MMGFLLRSAIWSPFEIVCSVGRLAQAFVSFRFISSAEDAVLTKLLLFTACLLDTFDGIYKYYNIRIIM